jgi:catechol 2,3-dioxygenase-like lactoylglutathione lyase family enzyme
VSKIQHIAIRAHENVQLAEFYKTTFGMKEVFRQPGTAPGSEAVYLSDGHINVAFLPCPADKTEGIDHFGFQVEDVPATEGVAKDAGASQGASGVPRDGRFAEVFVRDPVGVRIDLSTAGWATQPLSAEESAARLQGISASAQP